jgi:acyl dehydratase
MKHAHSEGEELSYQVRARNTATESENKIHDDHTAARYGFRGGLVPGVVVYGYMTAPLVERFSLGWLERGSIQIRFHQPFYDGEQVTVRAEVEADSDTIKVALRAERETGMVAATAMATVEDQSAWLGEPRIEDYPEAPLPPNDARPAPSAELFTPGLILGAVVEKLDLSDRTLLDALDEKLPLYFGSQAVAHPTLLLSMANQSLVKNFKLGPWIHAASDIINWSVARGGERVSARSRVRECFERKGHQFVVIDCLVVANDERVIQQVRHTAIYRPRMVDPAA